MSTRAAASTAKPQAKRASSSRAPIRRTEIDGVPCYWTPVPGPFTAALLFRVGRRDETLPTAGITHLVEHLALSHLDPHDLSYNGQVEIGATVFHASGSKADVTDFLSSTTSALTSLPLERFEAETRVLTSEASTKSMGIFERMCSFRFGPRGPGLIGYDELGLRAIDGSTAQRWADERFSTGDAVLLLTGSPPRGLRLNLNDGERTERDIVEELEQPLPSFAVGDDFGVAVSFIAPRSAASMVMTAVVQKRLHDRLRRDMGVTYHASAIGEPIGEDDRLFVIGADIHGDQRADGWGEIVTILRELADEGPTRRELDWVRSKYRESIRPAHARFVVLDWFARDTLDGRKPRVLESRLKDLAAVSSSDVADVLAAGLDRALWIVPGASKIPDGDFQPFNNWSADRVSGRRYRTKASLSTQNTAEGRVDAKRRLVVGPDGVTLLHTKREYVTVRYRECAGLLTWTNGDRVLIGNDGFSLPVTVGKWLRGRRAVSDIDARLQPELVIPMGEALPQRRPTQAAGPSPAFETFMRAVGWLFAALAWVFVLGGFANFADARSRSEYGLVGLILMVVVPLAIAGALTWGLVHDIRKRRQGKSVKTTAG